ncbi:SMI1/KNR4 family protein [Nannocystis punicea]|uniref:SMI1/KNR4 family protein n=1 Tax=Nannocystis punicea TaxID=2995304 RepID=A0ABY7GU60_9BACT|nr:SMI1/KNR4 family protein [Nannocystis poenicansa]WAS90506.1 SMI1/KNR4 family protein [Nannocystis poenicansa]
MQLHELEPEMEEFLARLVPGLSPAWSGVTADEVAQVEDLAGRPLPRFYRWFLRRLGRDMGPLRYRSLDFSPAQIVAAYSEGLVERGRRYLLIGRDLGPATPSHAFYDLDQPVRDDAMVVSGEALDDELEPSFETFREMLAWGALLTHGIQRHPQRCVGVLKDRDGDVRARLDPVLHSLGFACPIAAGRWCGVYRGPHADMISKVSPAVEPRLHVFRIGATDSTTIRRILGEIVSETSLELKIDGWQPELA